MKLYVGNLSRTITDKKLNDLATPYGKVLSANVATEQPSGDSRGFGFVEFGSEEDARKAITGLNGREIEGKLLKVNEARPAKDGTAPPRA